MSTIDQLKVQAAHAAAERAEPGMVLGLGFGSTAAFAVEHIAERYRAGELDGILGVPTALQVEQQAQALGIPLTTLENHPRVDLTIDGADEVDPQLDLIKGGGGALLREKIVAQASDREIIVVDESKLSDQLGTRFALPVEVLPFGWAVVRDTLEGLGATVSLRMRGEHQFLTDQGNWILDAAFGPIRDAYALAEQLDRQAAVVGHGLFLGLATEVMVAGESGLRRLQRA
jgi:ribose 5-phosphate isomerase A